MARASIGPLTEVDKSGQVDLLNLNRSSDGLEASGLGEWNNFLMTPKRKSKGKGKVLTQDEKKQMHEKIDGILFKAKSFVVHMNKTADVLTMDLENIALNNREKDSSVLKTQPSLFSGSTLWQHQIDGYQWLKFQYLSGLNCILADEMGLGKTAQVIATIADLVHCGCQGPFLICVPLSTLQNWCDEFERFTPKIPVIQYHGSKSEKTEFREQISQKQFVTDSISCYPVVIASFDTIMKDYKMSKMAWEYLVIDEGHRLKNANSKLFMVLKKYQNSHCSTVLLTGTPIQNSITELWSLLNFLMPEIFTSFKGIPFLFDTSALALNDAENFITQEEKDHLIEKIQQIITPFILRRTKKEVALNLPPKKEIIIYTPLTDFQSQLYSKILAANKTTEINDESLIVKEGVTRKRKRITYFINSDSDEDDTPFIDDSSMLTVTSLLKKKEENLLEVKNENLKFQSSNVLMSLRKVCLHPLLIRPQKDVELSSITDVNLLISQCGKLIIFDNLLSHLKKFGHKILIFSQFRIMLDILEKYCELKNIKFCRLDGQTDLETRNLEIKKFQKKRSIFLFLLSTRAGGLGINLTAADTVIIYDSDWNPQQDIQAQDRCHRLGQNRPVIVYRFVSENTVDEDIMSEANGKLKLEKLIMQEGRFSTKDTLSKVQYPLTSEEMKKVFLDSNSTTLIKCDKEAPLSPAMLDFLLDRSSMF